MTADDGNVERLRSLGGRVALRSMQLEQFRKLVEPLRAGGLEPVDGELDLLKDLEENLHDAVAILTGPEGASLSAMVDELDTLVNDVVWEIEEDLRADLDSKRLHQEERLRAIDLDLKTWENLVTESATRIETARFEGAPFSALEGDLERARRQLASIRTAISDRLYGGLPALRTSAADAMALLGANVKRAESQVDRVKTLVKQADLLIMQVGASAEYLEYRVLLRSADRFQTRGINIIQDVRRVSRADRAWMLSLVAQLTGRMNRDIRAAHVVSHPAPEGELRTISPADDAADDALPEANETVRVLGDAMYRLVIPPEIQKYLSDQLFSFSITTNDLELPWELISAESLGSDDAESRHLCLERCISRMPLGGGFPPPPSRRAPGPVRKRRMLLIHSDQHGTLPAAAHEADAIAKALSGVVDIERVDPGEATNTRLNSTLFGKSFDFLHYAGHAFFDPANPDQSGLQLKDALLTAEKIRLSRKGGTLVFLNACESGTIARDTQAQHVSYLLAKPEPVVGLASAFVYSGALGCVGSLWPVYDKPAAELAVLFYQYVLSGEPIGEALRRARNDIRVSYPREVTWAGYVLYGDPTFRLTES